jgi:photosystem II stability/assembly factor-like uncharacterized protein
VRKLFSCRKARRFKSGSALDLRFGNSKAIIVAGRRVGWTRTFLDLEFLWILVGPSGLFPERERRHLNNMHYLFCTPRLALTVIFTFCVLGIPANAQTWTPVGPPGGDVRAMVFDPVRPNVLYLGTADGYILSSQDAGEHWESRGRVANGVITTIIATSDNSGGLFAAVWTGEANGEGGGVFLSRDDGRTWRGSGLEGHAVRALVQAQSDKNILIAGALDGVFRSNDWGKTWERITPSGDSELRNFDSLAIDPQDPGTIYAGTFHLPWKTVDGGRHWMPIHRGMIDDSDVLSLELSLSNPQQIFASACSGIYRSNDAGSSWNKIEGVPYSARRTLTIREAPWDPAILFAGTTEGLWKTSDGGARWQRISPRDWVVNSIVIEPGTFSSSGNNSAEYSVGHGRLLIGTRDRGVLGSDDGGAHFRVFNTGFHHRQVILLAVDREKTATVAAVLTNSPDQVVQSDDGGQNWFAIDAGLNGEIVKKIFASPAGWLAAMVSGGLAHFDSVERKWLPLGNKESAHFFVNDMDFNTTEWLAASPDGLFITRDNGITWSAFPFSTGNLAVDSVRASRDGQEIRLVSSNAMVFSDDAGKSWTWKDLPLDSGGALRLETADDATLLAAARNGLYVSRDDGASWQRLQNGLPTARPDDLLIRGDFWLVSMHGRGLFLSLNHGGSWSPMKGGDDGPFIQPTILANGSNDGPIYAGSANNGLYFLDPLHTLALKTTGPKTVEK